MKQTGANQVEPAPEAVSESMNSAADVNYLYILRPFALWVEDHHGQGKLREMIDQSGLLPEDFDGENRWGPVEKADAFLTLVYELVNRNDKFFADLAGYKLVSSWGPMRFILRARSPKFLFERVAKDFHIVTTISKNHLENLSDHSCTIRYTTTKPESRVLCLSRQGSNASLLTLWGLPKAELTEGRCVARGDECCEYHLRWYRHQRNTWPLIGFLVGVALFLAGYFINPAVAPYLLTPALTFPLLGYLVDLWKTNKTNLRIGDAMTAETRELLHADAVARKEMLLLHERQRQWESVVTKRGVEGMAERQRLVEHLEALQEPLEMNIRGLGHDIRTPLAVLRTHNTIMKMSMDGEKIDKAELNEILDLQDVAIDKITDLVTEMMKVAKARKPLKSVNPQNIDVMQLSEELKSRINALAHGQPIDTDVHVQDPVPKLIRTDQLMLDRIIDNLLINATKYTQQGRIDVWLRGWNDNFVFEVRDTGRGIAESDFPKIFQPEGSDASTRESGSYGLGLSVVTLLLAQLGGQLVVESQPGQGSSFRCVLPVQYQPTENGEGDIASLNSRSLYKRVVSILPPSSALA